MSTKKAAKAIPAEIQDDINRARLAHLVRALQGAFWRVGSLATAMEHAIDNADDMPMLRSVLKDDLKEAASVGDEHGG